MSAENLQVIDAEHIFIYADIGGDPEALLANNALFQHFASNREVHYIRGEYWFRPGAASAQRIIDDLYREVLGKDPAELSPNPLAWTYQAP